GGREACTPAVGRAWVRVRGAGPAPAPRPLAGALLPHPGAPEGAARAAGLEGGAPWRRGRDPRGAARAVPRARARCRSRDGGRAARRDRLLRDPAGREDPPLLRARLRGEGPWPRTHPAHQAGSAGALTGITLRDAFRPSSRPHTMAYALVRIVESFLYAEAIAGEEPDLEKAVEILRLLLR